MVGSFHAGLWESVVEHGESWSSFLVDCGNDNLPVEVLVERLTRLKFSAPDVSFNVWLPKSAEFTMVPDPSRILVTVAVNVLTYNSPVHVGSGRKMEANSHQRRMIRQSGSGIWPRASARQRSGIAIWSGRLPGPDAWEFACEVDNAFSPLNLANSRGPSGMQPNHISSSHKHDAKLLAVRMRFLQHLAGHLDHQASFVWRKIYLSFHHFVRWVGNCSLPYNWNRLSKSIFFHGRNDSTTSWVVFQ